MKLNQATRLAIWSIVELASRPGEQIPVNDIAETYGISQHHLAKVLRTPSRAGIVASTRGPGGGCEFTGNANRLTLYDIIQLFEEEPFQDQSSEDPPTPVAAEVAHVLAEIDRITKATLKSVTIQTVIKNAQRKQKRLQNAASHEAASKEKPQAD